MTEQANDIETLIRNQIKENPVLLYMKARHSSHSVVSLQKPLKY